MICLSAYLLATASANAQLSSNPDKFLGNITTSGQVDFGNEKFYTLWNQITYQTMSGKLAKHLAKGEQILRFTITDANCNIDKVQLKCTLNTSVEAPAAGNGFGNGTLFNLQGVPVDSRYRGIVIKNGRKVINKEL